MDKKLREDQRHFALLGLYDPDKIDGLYGRRTQTAIDAFCHYEQLQDDQYRQALWNKIRGMEPPEYFDAETLLPALYFVAKQLYLDQPEQVAYLMATVEHETKAKYYPVREAFWMDERARERYLKRQKYGLRWSGRGLVQLTWKSNYEKYQAITGLPLVADPDLTLDPTLSLFILVHGIKTGTFTGVGLEHYINRYRIDMRQARRVVNGMDKAEHIAALAEKWLAFINEQLKQGVLS